MDVSKEYGDDIKEVKINWCPECMDNAEDEYFEEPIYNKVSEDENKVSVNQQSL